MSSQSAENQQARSVPQVPETERKVDEPTPPSGPAAPDPTLIQRQHLPFDAESPNPPDVLGQQLLFEGAPALHIARPIFPEPISGIETRTLANDIKVHYIDRPRTMPIEVSVLVKAGALQDPLEKSGLAHFVEHMAFGGTTRNPTSLSFARMCTDEGIGSNAFTDRLTTTYTVEAPVYRAEAAVRILGEVLRTPRFDEQEVIRQRSIVVAEIFETYEANNFGALYQLQFERLIHGAWGGAQPVIGTRQHVSGITAEDVRSFYHQHYHGGAMEVLVLGPVSTRVMKLIEEHLGAIPSRGKTGFTPGSPRQVHEPLHVDWKSHDRNGTAIYVAFPAPHEHSLAGVAGFALRQMAGRGNSSPIHQMLRLTSAVNYGHGVFSSRSPAGAFDTIAFTSARADAVERGLQALERAIAMFKDPCELRRLLEHPELGPREYPKLMSGVILSNLAYFGSSYSPDQVHQLVRQLGPEDIADYVKTFLDPARAKVAIRSNQEPRDLPPSWCTE